MSGPSSQFHINNANTTYMVVQASLPSARRWKSPGYGTQQRNIIRLQVSTPLPLFHPPAPTSTNTSTNTITPPPYIYQRTIHTAPYFTTTDPLRYRAGRATSLADVVSNGASALPQSGPKPSVKIDNQTDPFSTIVVIQYGDKLGELLDTVSNS